MWLYIAVQPMHAIAKKINRNYYPEKGDLLNHV